VGLEIVFVFIFIFCCLSNNPSGSIKISKEEFERLRILIDLDNTFFLFYFQFILIEFFKKILGLDANGKYWIFQLFPFSFIYFSIFSILHMYRTWVYSSSLWLTPED